MPVWRGVRGLAGVGSREVGSQESEGYRPLARCGSGRGDGRSTMQNRNRANHYFLLHNQWQVGNFWAEKPVKAGREVLLDLY